MQEQISTSNKEDKAASKQPEEEKNQQQSDDEELLCARMKKRLRHYKQTFMSGCNELDDSEFITHDEEQGWQVKPATNFELPIFVNPQANTFRCNLMFDMVKIVTEAIHDYQNYFGNNRFDKYWNVEIRLSLRPHFEHAVHQLLTKSKIPLPLRLIHVLLTAQEHWSVIIQEARPILD